MAARAQQVERRRRVVALLGGLAPGDTEGEAEVAAFEEGLKQAGWNIGGNIEVDYRWPGVAPDRQSADAKEIADTRPDLVLTRSTPATAALMNTNLPVVFTLVADPLGSGFIQSLAKPGKNFTGFRPRGHARLFDQPFRLAEVPPFESAFDQLPRLRRRRCSPHLNRES